MKLITAMSLMLFSVSAFSFTTVTLNKDIVLKKSTYSNSLIAFESESKGNNSCRVTLSSDANQEKMIVKAGTTLEVVGNVFEYCGRDWGRVCSVTLNAENREQDVNVSVSCKDTGMFATTITVEKANRIAKKLITIK